VLSGLDTELPYCVIEMTYQQLIGKWLPIHKHLLM
jgi:hypothetical protein